MGIDGPPLKHRLIGLLRRVMHIAMLGALLGGHLTEVMVLPVSTMHVHIAISVSSVRL